MHVVAIFCVMTVVICGALVAKRLVFCGAPYAGPLGGGSGHVDGEGAAVPTVPPTVVPCPCWRAAGTIRTMSTTRARATRLPWMGTHRGHATTTRIFSNEYFC